MFVEVGIFDRHHRVLEMIGDFLGAEDNPLFEAYDATCAPSAA